MLLVISLQLLC